MCLTTYGTWEVDDNNEFVVTSAPDDTTVVWDTPGTLTDFTVTATFHKAGDRAGLVGRLQDAVSFYTLRVRARTVVVVLPQIRLDSNAAEIEESCG